MEKKPRLLLLHSDVSPYRLPLFELLAKEVDLRVYFCDFKASRRNWELPLNKYKFDKKILKCFHLGPFMINPTLPLKLLFNRFDAYILGEDDRTFFSELIVFLMAKLYGRPVIVWSGFLETNYFEKYKNIVNQYLLQPVYKLIYRFSDSFISYGKVTRQYLLKKGVPPEKIMTGTQSLCTRQLMKYKEDIDDGSKESSPYKGKKAILCVSYFDNRKGIDLLINAYKSLNRSDTALIIAGAGKEEENLKLLAHGRNDIFFPGYIETKEKVYYYSMADIFVLPTLSDAWGLVVNEAMMFGLPIITTNKAGCSQELISGNGFVVNAGNSIVLKDAMKKVLDDENMRREMGEKSRQIISKFTIENAKKTFLAAIELALETKLTGVGNDLAF